MRKYRIRAGIVTEVLHVLLLICLLVNYAYGGTPSSSGTPLLYGTDRDIRLTNISRGGVKSKAQILVRNLTKGGALDFHYAAQKLCWTDQGLETIHCVSYNGTDVGNKTDIITTGLISPEGLACDWFTNKLYWTDSETNRIEVATMTGEYRKVLFWWDIDQPRAIVVVPMRGFMFWSDWGEITKIERAGMNGDPKTRKIIVSKDIFWPNGLTVDYEAELLYWLDAKLRFIAVVDYNGQNRTQIVTSGLYYPFSITHFQNKLYWTDWETWSIYSCDKNITSYNVPRELFRSDFVPMYVRVWHSSRQPAPISNPCAINNGGCSHLCLLSEQAPGYTCACPIGIKLLDDKNCASGPQHLLLLALRTDICYVYLDSPDYTHEFISLHGIKHAINVDYDPVEGFLYWTDDEVNAIGRARLNGSDQQVVIGNDIYHPDGLGVDWVAGNLYWADTGTDRLEVSRLNGSYRRVLLYEDLIDPRAIAIAPEHGWLFWSDWNEKAPKIERASLDGTDRIILVNKNLGWPNGVALDLERSKMYWCDAKTDIIEMANMDGTERIVLLNDHLPHPFGLSVMGDYIYWTDWHRRSIDRVTKTTGSNRDTITDQIPNVMGLKAVRIGEFRTGTNPCAKNNGGCSHLCLNRPKGLYVCACQMNYELASDEKTCVLPDAFLLYSRNGTLGRLSITNGHNKRNNQVIPVAGIKLVSSLDFDISNDRLYWMDTKLRAIFRTLLNGSDTQRVLDLPDSTPEGLAIDWEAHNMYWTDTLANRIEVARLDGSSRRALLWNGLDEPKDIVIEPQYGYMYWLEWGSSNCIKRAMMNGSNPSILVRNVERAQGFAIDHDARQLYWTKTDLHQSILYMFDLQTRARRPLTMPGASKPSSISIYKDKIYWSEQHSDEVYVAEKQNLSTKTLLHNGIPGVSNLIIVHDSRQHSNGYCSNSNAGCSHLCLPVPAPNKQQTDFRCACPTHYTLNGTTCNPPSSFMIYSQRNSVVRLLPDTENYFEVVLPIQGLKLVKAVDFDPVSRYLYWIDGKTHSIKRALDNGSTVSVIVPGSGADQKGGPYDLAIDSLGRLLFWTCTTDDVINVTRLDNNSVVGVVVKNEGQKPRLLAIHTIKRLLFWTDNGNVSQLVRTRLDGSHRIVIKSQHNITALAVDLDTDMVVWAEGLKVFMCNIDGENEFSFLSENKAAITQMAVHAGFMYWFEKSQNQLRRFHLADAQHSPVKLSHNVVLTDLVSVRQPPQNHSCSGNNRCSHICIGNETTVLCACPQGFALRHDRGTCLPVPNCGRDYFTCGRGRYTAQSPHNDCIPASWRCDGHKDCADESDEANCPLCRTDQFRCQTGECIEQSQVCDGTDHCPDGFDEQRCCSKDEFKCPQTEVCLQKAQLCDGMEHCANGADESDAVCAAAGRHTLPNKSTNSYDYVIIISGMLVAFAFSAGFFIYYRCRNNSMNEISLTDQSSDPLSPKPNRVHVKSINKRTKPMPDMLAMPILNGSDCTSYERRHVTGASSSTNGSSLVGYPRETLNPPPSPATTAASTRGSSPGRYRPYRHYRSINQPPPPTPCSTDVCDESDCNYPTRSRYDAGPFPPPPTPRSHCHSESCPPSPSSRSSTYFNPLPPPPSPVPSPPHRGYDS